MRVGIGKSIQSIAESICIEAGASAYHKVTVLAEELLYKFKRLQFILACGVGLLYGVGLYEVVTHQLQFLLGGNGGADAHLFKNLS